MVNHNIQESRNRYNKSINKYSKKKANLQRQD